MLNGEGQGKERKAPPKYPVIDKEIKRRGSVRKFVKAAGIHEQTYYAIQSGRETPTLRTIFAILRYTELDFDTAFENEKCRHGVADRDGGEKPKTNSSRFAY